MTITLCKIKETHLQNIVEKALFVQLVKGRFPSYMRRIHVFLLRKEIKQAVIAIGNFSFRNYTSFTLLISEIGLNLFVNHTSVPTHKIYQFV